MARLHVARQTNKGLASNEQKKQRVQVIGMVQRIPDVNIVGTNYLLVVHNVLRQLETIDVNSIFLGLYGPSRPSELQLGLKSVQ